MKRRYVVENEISDILYEGTFSTDKESIEHAFVEHYTISLVIEHPSEMMSSVFVAQMVSFT